MIQFQAIGHAETPYSDIANMPIQGAGLTDNQGRLVITPQYAEGLDDLHEFSHIYVLFHLHRSQPGALKVTPFLDTVERGIFATRSPKRPNPIGLSIVAIDRIVDNVIHVRGIDLLDGTPIIDVKPYIQAFDNIPATRDGWYERGMKPTETLSDRRFG
ncbi:tRNA (N6-threonylcarbamoyladenosine(37)-N6)-methyltransferase TrmO [Ferrimonas balearica]|uniref:tRNA (N6-threonylcarbamoyladenosine(37)-N6)-methyltransferase TrmO n=1 Tax=Ferrimonas balearica TaxID=44012 RepID=UPI001C98D5C0|nr:tRNA (N6-threonylcarbamoyladenosine(37)-N6)-methyltransferase TrmO [Ferrimonas balearica]MBY5979361.1 tRNA (N6-threonylcarbamoyladenosine(37)-N6)-methyltransferase TrmO [Ferrimonas balearica]MBY6223814.1 tRNA (N6-threonylcarbamoyladenosine(37)-N6)-methyltransferase TrmO [Ferrimonas balearica]